jgi:bidirectional [NiFe] hydrogenase diaphorase subunit
VSPEELRQVAEREAARRARLRGRVAVCVAAGCEALGADEARAAFEREVAAAGLAGEVEVHGTGCLGLCHRGAMVQVEGPGPDGHPCRCLHEAVDGPLAARIVREHLAAGRPVEERRRPADDPFLAGQTRLVLSGSGEVDPERIETAIGAGAFEGLRRALLELTPEEVRREIDRSGLRGRGGAGYPTGLKWGTVAKAPGAPRAVICNADEGDPGAFMNRSVLEGDPQRVLEGMAIAAHAVGADRGWVYVRGEHPLPVRRVRLAIAQATERGLLGQRILDTPFDFRVEVRVGAGAYVCGEETALIASVEGRRGTPRPRPPWPATSGLHGLPTLINNVETLANVPAILRRGGAWFAGVGAARSPGTKVFALAGQVVNTGLVEVPLGTTLREVIVGIGGGVPGGRALKAAQTGGPSGGCVPASHLDLPLQDEALRAAGSSLGSGGLIVLGEGSCLVDLARYYMGFCRAESCGKCVPCRAGTVQLHELLERICRGQGEPADLGRLEALSELLAATSLCGLGQGAPTPVRSTLRWFRDEYLAHVSERRCPAGTCRMGSAHAAPAEASP